MIDGLRMTMTGEDVRRVLGERIEHHRQKAKQWMEDAHRPDQRSGLAAWMPPEDCEDIARKWEWRAQRLEFLREHLDPSQVYLIGPGDLKFSELLPPKPEPAGTWSS